MSMGTLVGLEVLGVRGVSSMLVVGFVCRWKAVVVVMQVGRKQLAASVQAQREVL